MNEKTIQNKILLLSGAGCRLFRANSGVAWQGVPVSINGELCLKHIRKVNLMPIGTPDIIGFKSVKITPEMVGHTVAIFTAIEVKKVGKNPTKEQQNFIDFTSKHGAMSGCAHSTEEAKKILWMD